MKTHPTGMPLTATPNLVEAAPLVRVIAEAGAAAVFAAHNNGEPPVGEMRAAVMAAEGIVDIVAARPGVLTADERVALESCAQLIRDARAMFTAVPISAGESPDEKLEAEMLGRMIAHNTEPMLEAAATLSALAARTE